MLMLLLYGFRSIAQEEGEFNRQWLKNEKIAESNLALVQAQPVIPFLQLNGMQAASVNFGAAFRAVFDAQLNKYAPVTAVDSYPPGRPGGYNQLNDDLKLSRTVICRFSPDFPFDNRLLMFLRELKEKKKVVIVLSGKTNRTAFFRTLELPVLWCRENTAEGASVLAQALFGGIGISRPAIRIKYSVPEDAGINTSWLDNIDIVMKEAIAARAAPGGVVAIVKDGKMIYCKAFGKHTYTGYRQMQTSDIFDMASLTKTSATTLEVMQLTETGKLALDSPISKYISRVRDMPDKKNILVREVMLHEAGFTPFITFYKDLKPGDLSTGQNDEYPTAVADNYFIRKNYYQEVMWPQMLADRALTRGKYVYSDLSMYYMKEIIEKVSAVPLDEFVDDHFYRPLGMQFAGFLPRKRFAKDKIVPTTENDGWFRNMLVQGYVDDPGAAMAGGVSGHAGFFASANDLAILYQMLLNKGSYGGTQYFKPETVSQFTSGQSKVSRRGFGFDRKDPDPLKSYPSALASAEVFGHTGYTGTAVWVDPASQLVYIFLSNRVYPDDQSKSLLTLNIRSRIQDIIYHAIQRSSR